MALSLRLPVFDNPSPSSGIECCSWSPYPLCGTEPRPGNRLANTRICVIKFLYVVASTFMPPEKQLATLVVLGSVLREHSLLFINILPTEPFDRSLGASLGVHPPSGLPLSTL